ncbi:MAG: hypothetical protein HYZ10_11350 [Ignavibacteriales bacterium]|nr:hypothetical protein [Ignavibacteriales bacterium]OGU83901.1 MAG: hypothetical protein A2279_05680 [Stygiobacter sp. RIFOXYA12_FULL_38_9]OGV06983.1 MAG: hypothetical protein A2299_17425 [Stygiobacter sp. RIFOXYB2_FULL_37_11]OGV12010.1 MAG: hypothetical protein A2237_15585 [Stygiobacter sp. RIFOXYA2_FULL_38_8]OGV14440.1 MAG: hypothetical protein A2440_08340 [Stygiobacter sp. RIFOXYC2_FULL_38_25]OGV29877.1 MAG: hypothetical protein A2499_02275 [Stygiobacter sp. RIFOXYC12_FULL_38_8]OGV82200.1
MKRKYISAIIILLFCGKMFSQSTDNKILFLDFKLVSGNPVLVGMKAVDGKLKIHKKIQPSNNCIEFTLLSAGNKILYQNIAENPAECVYEYPAGEGKIGRTTIKQDTVSLTLRVPYSSAIEKIRLNLIDKTHSLRKTSGSSNRSSYEFTIDHNKISVRK